ALERQLVAQATARFDLAMNFFVAEIKNGYQRRRTELFAGRHDSVKTAGLPEGAQELHVRSARVTERRPLCENNGPGHQRKANQHNHDAPSERGGTTNHLYYIQLQQ